VPHCASRTSCKLLHAHVSACATYNAPHAATHFSRSVAVASATATAPTAEFTIEFDQLGDWINDVKKIFNTELFENGKKK
jgi:hypothetical protein